MAWTNISNALVSVGALPFATTIQALRDNPIAIADGDAGAPRVQTAGIADNAVTTAKIAAGERMTTANVLGQTAGAALGAVGSYAFCRGQGAGPLTAGATISGSFLRYSSTGAVSGATPAGTWRAMGTTGADAEATLYLRIS
jgi:hypothetical protein